MVLTQRKKPRQSKAGDGSGTENAGSDTTPNATPNSQQRIVKEIHVVNSENRPIYRSGRVLFSLGIVFGVLLGFVFVEPQDIQDIQSQMALLMSEYQFDLPQLPDIDFSRLEDEWSRFRSSIPEVWKFNNDGREFQVGDQMKERGLGADHPVILIPGIISTGLESWSTEPEYRAFFREKVWGGFNMLSRVTFNKEKWINAMILDPVTGLDPPGAKIRAAEGIDAASTFIQGFWLWSKIVENLAAVDYDTNNLYMAPYDWRLSYYNLEERDGYFSKLKQTIEGFKKRHNKKVVVAAHSMGSTVMLYFFKWVESPEHGKGGSQWVESHIEAYISIAGTHLGVVKAMAAFYSGEMKDTVQMNPAGAYVLERFFSRKERKSLFLSWAGSASLWMKGGNAVWGNGTSAPDDDLESTHSHGDLISFRAKEDEIALQSPLNEPKLRNMTADDASQWIIQHTPLTFQRMMNTNYSFGIERDEKVLKLNDLDHRKWTNPLEVRLPNAPSMKFYCVYGAGKETERSYWYARGGYEDADLPDNSSVCSEEPCSANETTSTAGFLPRESWIDFEYTNESSSPRVVNGVKMGDGDGTVNLLSLGAMCVEGWKRPRWNPAGIKVKTIELPHRPVASIPRGGANTSDHVDILGSTGLNEIILKIATGVGGEIEESFVSNIQEYAKRVQWD